MSYHAASRGTKTDRCHPSLPNTGPGRACSSSRHTRPLLLAHIRRPWAEPAPPLDIPVTSPLSDDGEGPVTTPEETLGVRATGHAPEAQGPVPMAPGVAGGSNARAKAPVPTIESFHSKCHLFDLWTLLCSLLYGVKTTPALT